MFCSKCGAADQTAAFCSNCGNAMNAVAPTPAPPFAPPVYETPVAAVGNTFSTIGIVLGAFAFLFLPIVFGPAGLVLGAVGKSKGEPRAIIAMVVSGVGLVVGMILGVIASSVFSY